MRELTSPAPSRTLVLAARKSSPITPALDAIAAVLAAAVSAASR